MLSAVPIPDGIFALKFVATIDVAVMIPDAFMLFISNPSACKFCV